MLVDVKKPCCQPSEAFEVNALSFGSALTPFGGADWTGSDGLDEEDARQCNCILTHQILGTWVHVAPLLVIFAGVHLNFDKDLCCPYWLWVGGDSKEQGAV